MYRILYHKASGQACILHQKKRHYLGKWDNHPGKPPEAVKRRFEAVIARLAMEAGTEPVGSMLLSELAAAWVGWARTRYENPRTAQNLWFCVKPLVDLFGTEPASSVGPRKVAQAQQLMAKQGRTRQGVNMATGYIGQMFAWGVAQEILHPDQLARLRAMQPLRHGAIEAPESPPREAVPLEVVKASLPFMSPTVAAMVRLQMLTGMRPGEVCSLTMSDIDRSNRERWVFTPRDHKTAHLGKVRSIPLLQPAMDILGPFLRADGLPVFSPAEEIRRWREEKRAKRKTKVQPSQLDRSKDNPEREPGDRYTTTTYRRACQTWRKSRS